MSEDDDEAKAVRAAQWDAQVAAFDARRRERRARREAEDRHAIAEHAARRAAVVRQPRRELPAHAAPAPVDLTRIDPSAMRIIPGWWWLGDD